MHPNITRSWHDWIVEGNDWKSVLVVETDLELRQGAPGFNEARFNELVEAAVRSLAACSADRLNIIPKGVRCYRRGPRVRSVPPT